ncbi:hypothetical protein SAMN04487886_108512 [Clostridium sp. DSM 8431]|uniref:hypothetical protein n=1 Tax=Clostridium sp. DSM 8431 TaxID=1761781 RepID=UPI0008E67934|nr:hypothetical protein [Clostridium sp. DSM 8431]SFU64386.1 hypothetical protein SAMN04487886_108512 [Clostridium sp. DSM 8431]
MWIKSLNGRELNKCIRVYIDENYKVDKKKTIALVGVIDCSTYGEQTVLIGSYINLESALTDLQKIEDAISEGKNISTL